MEKRDIRVQEQNKQTQNQTYRGFQSSKHGIDHISSTVAATEAILQSKGCKNNVMQLVLVCKFGYH